MDRACHFELAAGVEGADPDVSVFREDIRDSLHAQGVQAVCRCRQGGTGRHFRLFSYGDAEPVLPVEGDGIKGRGSPEYDVEQPAFDLNRLRFRPKRASSFCGVVELESEAVRSILHEISL